MKITCIVDIDNAKDKGALISRLLADKLEGRPTREIVDSLLAFMTLDEREDAVVAICGIVR